MEGQLAAVVTAALVQLVVHSGLVHTDAHGGDLKGAIQHGVVHQDIAVQGPVVVVGGAAVVRLAAALQVIADLHQEHGVVLLTDRILTLLRRIVGPAVLQLLGGDKEHLAVQLGVQAGERDLQGVFGLYHSAHDGAHGLLQIGHVAVAALNDLLPVPLVHIHGVEVVHFLIAADSVHIGEQALAGLEVVALQRQTLPLGQGMHHLALCAHIRDIEGHRALHAIEVIVQTRILLHEQGSRNAPQIERLPQIHLEIALDELDCALHLIGGQRRLVPSRDRHFAHA